MHPDNAIEVERMSKQLRLRRAGGSLKSALLDRLRGRSSREAFWALRDISFDVRRGETLGIVGANGAGKTTLLSLIARTMRPSEGRIDTRGAISSLLELGAGFHPDLTGRENVYLAGVIMGLRREQIRKRFDAIVEFAGLSRFIDQPVKHYSSGMYVRLGFAVAVEVDPDILLIDEVLAVGDIDFQQKCIKRMHRFHDENKTMLIVSHDLPTIQSLSDRILLLDEGRVVNMGRPAEIIGAYRSQTARKQTAAIGREWGSGELRFGEVTLRDAEGHVTDAFRWGAPLVVDIAYHADRRIERPVFGFALSDKDGRLIFGSNTLVDALPIPYVEGAGRLRLTIRALNMARGAYTLSLSAHSADHRVNYHRLDHAFPFRVECDQDFEGVSRFPCAWEQPARA